MVDVLEFEDEENFLEAIKADLKKDNRIMVTLGDYQTYAGDFEMIVGKLVVFNNSLGQQSISSESIKFACDMVTNKIYHKSFLKSKEQ